MHSAAANVRPYALSIASIMEAALYRLKTYIKLPSRKDLPSTSSCLTFCMPPPQYTQFSKQEVETESVRKDTRGCGCMLPWGCLPRKLKYWCCTVLCRLQEFAEDAVDMLMK
jgi:hypothetical protein